MTKSGSETLFPRQVRLIINSRLPGFGFTYSIVKTWVRTRARTRTRYLIQPPWTNRDILQRLNFLYQASVLLNGLAPSRSTSHNNDPSRPSVISTKTVPGIEEENSPLDPPKARKKRRRRVVSVEELSRSYVETMKSVGQKTNVRMDPSVKRCICKRCSAPLIPGISATVRVKDSSSHGHLISYQCHRCQTERRIPAPPLLHGDPQSREDTIEEIQSTEAPTTFISMPTGSSVHPEQRKKKKKGPQPRLPPHFARDVGHVVFRGNERLDTTS
ncbi:Rpr2-domain-containing protein [Chiua virens]|nr:Rpr2-domain-containing protein [Chiua virens]